MSGWTRPTPALPSVTQLAQLLPPGSLLHSVVRLEMDGLPPQETAVVAAVPASPGAAQSIYYGFIFAYDRWRRQTLRVYGEPLTSSMPVSLEVGQIDRRHEAAIFGVLHDDGRRTYTVVGFAQGRVGALDEETTRRLIARLTPPPAGVTWHYRLRMSSSTAQRAVLHVHAGQPVRIVPSGGGPAPVIIPDARLDVLEQGFRARHPGVYTIRMLLPFVSDDQGLTLALVVEP